MAVLSIDPPTPANQALRCPLNPNTVTCLVSFLSANEDTKCKHQTGRQSFIIMLNLCMYKVLTAPKVNTFIEGFANEIVQLKLRLAHSVQVLWYCHTGQLGPGSETLTNIPQY